MVSRKRTRAEAEDDAVKEPAQAQQQGLLHQIRSMWEFANLMQYIFTFGKLVKINDDIEIDDLETECLKPGPSEMLHEIGLSLLKFVSSHRGLTYDNFEEYTRRQYYAKAPGRNPFGDGEQPTKFNDFDVFQKLRILQQLSQWTFWNPDRIRERMPEQKETEQVQWRVEELGYDRDDRLYYVLDDNRLYRRTDPPIPPPKAAKPKANSKRGRALARAAKKRKTSEANATKEENGDDQKEDNDPEQDPSKGYKWECIAVSLAEYRTFLASVEKTKDPNEKILRDSLVKNVIPVIEQVEEAQQKKMQRREKELINLQKLANAKRSSRLAGKQEQQRQAIEEAEEQRKREAERVAERKKAEMQEKIEKERLDRLMTREQRLKEREEKRRLHEERLENMAEQTKKMEDGESRVSERHLKAEMAKREKDLAALQTEEDQWFFDCSGCGVHGENLDDGSHSVACEKCNVWQHSGCLGIPQTEAEKDDFHFVCKDCKRRIEEAKRPKIPPLKFRIPKPTMSPASTAVDGEKHEQKKQSQSLEKENVPVVPPPQVNMLPKMNGAASTMPRPAQNHVQPTAQSSTTPANANGLLPSQHRAQLLQNVTMYQGPSQQNQTSSSQVSAAPDLPPGHVRPDEAKSPLKIIQHYPPGTTSSAATSFNSQRPSSSSSKRSPGPSPIQNRPSMSPTQGNRDVGPLAGIPSSSQSNGALPSTPFGVQSNNYPNSGSPYPVNPPPNQPSPVSFSTTATPQATNSFSHTPPSNRYSPGVPMSGLSPTKHSPPRPPPFGSGGNASVLPPIQKLQPSPELMGRPSSDAPIPAPTKSMSPEQEERRRRENLLASGQFRSPQQQHDSSLPAQSQQEPPQNDSRTIRAETNH